MIRRRASGLAEEIMRQQKNPRLDPLNWVKV